MAKFKKKTKVSLLILTIIFGLIFFIFQEDIFVYFEAITNQYKVQHEEDNSPVFVGVIKPGYVEYLSDEEETEYEIIYPKLSKVRAEISIPRVKIKGNIVDGETEETMDLGFWHYPQSASPFASSGNTVIIGHRYLKLPPHTDTFYNLNHVKVGDKILLNSTYEVLEYSVRETKIVDSDDLTILLQTDNPQLTLVTCHPLWTSKQRLVIIADRVDNNE